MTKPIAQNTTDSSLEDTVDYLLQQPVDESTQIEQDAIELEPDFDTALPPSYPRKEPIPDNLKDGVRIAANTANKLVELGMNPDKCLEEDSKNEQDTSTFMDAADIFKNAFGTDSADLVAAESLSENTKTKKSPGRPPTKSSETKIDADKLFNTYTAMKLATILTEYDHKVVEDAAQMRTYVTNKLLEISGCGDSKQELRALELLGKISDVGLFSDKTEINVTHTTDSLEHAIKEKINRLMGQVHDAEFEEVIDPALEHKEEETDDTEDLESN